MYARIYARVSDCGQIIIRTHDQDRHTTGTGPPEHTTTGKGRTQEKRKNLNIYVCLQAMKKSQKKS